MRVIVFAASTAVLLGCAHSEPAGQQHTETKKYLLPSANGEVTLDYLLFDRHARRLWVPAGNTGNVDVLDVSSDTFIAVSGFAVVEREGKRGKRMLGPSSAAEGNGTIFVGNRGSSEICAINPTTLAKGACVGMPTPPDGIVFVEATNEVWSTTPRAQSITIIDAANPQQLSIKGTIPLDGEPEGYAVDVARGLFFTNLEDKDKTLAIDVKTHAVIATYASGCGESGPRGIAVDTAKELAFVACTASVGVLDVGHDGAVLSRQPAGEGIDNIDYVEPLKRLFVAAGKDARLTEFQVENTGTLRAVRTSPTVEGAKVVVADSDGNAYLTDPHHGGVMVVPAR